MRRRIAVALLGVTTLALVAFGVPLGAAVARLVRQQAVLRLEREASRASVEVSVPLDAGSDPSDLPRPDKGTSLALYDGLGVKVFGSGPASEDPVTAHAASGMVADGTVGDELVVAVPLVFNEEVVATVRASTPSSRVDRLVWLAIGAVVVVALAVLGVSAVIAGIVASRLAAPVTALVSSMGRLREGDLSARAPRSGVAELDAAAVALDDAATRFGGMLERERAFSADASHQLRTPLAALRLNAEAALADPDPAAREERLQAVVAATERLERTVVDLLALVRNPEPGRDRFDLVPLVDEVKTTWHGPLAAAGRRLTVRAEAGLPPCRASRAAVSEILSVLVGNALEHGEGAVEVRVAGTASGALLVEVEDEGHLAVDPVGIFRREPGPDGHGIGLGLARTLAEAEGARLLVETSPTTCFRLLLPSEAVDDAGFAVV
jgi:signal transduction histidine kinase